MKRPGKTTTKITNNIYVLAFVATVGGSLFGFDISSMSAWIGTPQYNDYFNSPSSSLQGGITASMSAGSFVGALGAGFLSDRIGRKRSIQVAAIIWIIGSIVTCSSQDVGQLIAGRVINGLSVGINSSQIPVYLAEVAPKRYRGRVVAIQQWAIEWGILIMYFLSYGCSFLPGSSSFRLAWGLQAVPAAFLFVALIPFPFSPRWLAARGRYDEALQVIADIHGRGDKTLSKVEAEFNDVKQAAEEAKQVRWHMLFGRRMWRRTLVGCFTQIWQQLTGGNVMMYYVVYVFDMAGLTGNANLVSSSIQYVIFVAMNVPAMIFIDTWGRRNMLLWGSAGMGAFNFIVGALLATHGHSVSSVAGDSNVVWTTDGGSSSKAIIACSFLFIAVYGLTWAPGAWVYVSEIWPQGYRAKGVGLCAASNWAFNFALAYFVPPAFKNIQWKTYMIFGAFCVTMGIHVFFMWPETCQKSLEDIEVLFDGSIPAWRSAKVTSRFDEEVAEIERRRRETKGSNAGLEDKPGEEKLEPEGGHKLEREDTLV